MNQSDFFNKVRPAAIVVQQLTGIDQNTVLSWMSWESDWGTNQGSKYNNYSGIKYTKNADFQIPGTSYAGYNSLQAYAKDYARILNVNGYGYPDVLRSAVASGNDVIAVTKALNASQYAEADYNLTTIANRARAAAGAPLTPTGIAALENKPKPTTPTSGGSGDTRFDSLNPLKKEIKRKALQGLKLESPTKLKTELYNIFIAEEKQKKFLEKPAI